MRHFEGWQDKCVKLNIYSVFVYFISLFYIQLLNSLQNAIFFNITLQEYTKRTIIDEMTVLRCEEY